ncbi:MAG: TonB-dependent receptor [Acidobacteriota bacterium]
MPARACLAAVMCGVLTLSLSRSVAAARAPTQAPVASTAGAPSVGGNVLDPESKAVVAAAVLVRNEKTNAIVTTTTDERGHFSAAVPAGTYTVEVAVPGFDILSQRGIEAGSAAATTLSVKLTVQNISEHVTVSVALPSAAAAAPSQGSLMARSAQSLISNEYIRNYTSPVSDYSQVIQMAPGTFNSSANGPGLSDTKTFFRGFKDGYYGMSYDGIPFNDTNDPTHHSWVFFPAQTIGSTVFDRSPGSAASIGPSTFGGSVNFLSPSLNAQQRLNGTYSSGSYNTKLVDLSYDTGAFANGRMRLMVEGHRMTSDGYQTFNFQDRKAFSAKYSLRVNDRVQLTALSSVVDLHSNTPDQKGSTRSQLAQFGNNFLMTNDPASPLYYKLNFYHIPTNFQYVGTRLRLGHGWSFDNKTYTMRYHNKQNFNSPTAISATSATDKLNAYWKMGNVIPLEHVSTRGIFRTGLWSEYASTNRYQAPSDPRTWVNTGLNFHEMFGTTTLQPYAEYEAKVTTRLTVTPGVKLAYYRQNFTQFADTKVVGNLNGAASVQHVAEYHSWLPSIDAHFLAQTNWSFYAQYGKGQLIPPTSIFDVTGAQVATLPNPTLTDTVQVGTVWKSKRATLDMDVFHIGFQNDYSSAVDPVSGMTNYFSNGTARTQGFEAESTILIGGGLALYMNGTVGSARYASTNEWVQNTPKDTETLGLTFNRGSWNLGFFSKRVGQRYNDNGAVHQAFRLDPFTVANLFFNYTLKGSSMFSQSRIRLAVNNLTDNQSITAIPKGGSAASTTANPNAGDLLNPLAGRSVSLSLTVGLSRKP